MQIELLRVDAVFELAGQGLVCAPSFPGPAAGPFQAFTATVHVQPPGQAGFEATATFSAIHFRSAGGADILMSLAGIPKGAVPRGSRIFAGDDVGRRLGSGATDAGPAPGVDSAAQVEKAFRSHLRSRAIKLSSLDLPQAFEAMRAYWASGADAGILVPDGDGIAACQEVTDHRRGTRLEIGFDRLLPIARDQVAVRLRLRVCYKWDREVIQHVLPGGMWSFTCWNAAAFDAFRTTVLNTAGYSTMQGKPPAEVNIVCTAIAWP